MEYLDQCNGGDLYMGAHAGVSLLVYGMMLTGS